MLVKRHGKYRAEARQHFIEGMTRTALIYATRGYSPRAAIEGYSLPGCLGRQYPNNAEKSHGERFLRVMFDDYRYLRPGVHGNRRSDYINPLYKEES